MSVPFAPLFRLYARTLGWALGSAVTLLRWSLRRLLLGARGGLPGGGGGAGAPGLRGPSGPPPARAGVRREGAR
ncbi:MAG TPA: hypothetical protein VFI25_09870 [Planctomycetota bacterium]|nr:hypothetical protein [Planctomycetota bacterium]